MTITRVGSNPKYAEGWDRAFGNKAKKTSAASSKAKPSPAKSGTKTSKSSKK